MSILLLQRAVDYARDAVDTVTPELLSRRTPCSEWDLRMLLRHTCESVAAFLEGLDAGRVGLFPPGMFPPGMDDAAADPAQALRAGIARLLDKWRTSGAPPAMAIADHRIPPSLMLGAAALEIAVHGWDISQATGRHQPVPPDLATDLLTISPLLVPDGNRHPLFGPPVPTPVTAGPGEELLAFLGRPATVISAPTTT